MVKYSYLLFDGRACCDAGDDRAICLTVSDSLEEAINDSENFGQCAVYRYRNQGNQLLDGRWICDCQDGRRLGEGPDDG